MKKLKERFPEIAEEDLVKIINFPFKFISNNIRNFNDESISLQGFIKFSPRKRQIDIYKELYIEFNTEGYEDIDDN